MTKRRAGKSYRRLYRLTAIIKTTRKMVGSDEFLICTSQRAGIKRKIVTCDPVRVLVQEIQSKKRGRA